MKKKLLNNEISVDKFVNFKSLLVLAVFVFTISYLIHFKYDSIFIIWPVIFFFSLAWINFVPLSIYSSIFASVILLPVDFPIKIGFFYLTISDIFIFITIILFISDNKNKIVLNYFSKLFLIFFSICILSVILSFNISLFLILLRFSIIIVFILILNSLSIETMHRTISMSLIHIPIVLCFYLLGLGKLFDFITFNNFTFGVVIGSHKYISFFLLTIPLLLYYKFNKIVILIAVIFIISLIFFSISRSLTISCFSVILIYIYNVNKNKMLKFIYLFSSIIIFLILMPILVFFSFSLESGSSKETSNFQRYFKITNSIEAFQARPFIGNGFGMSQIENTNLEDVNTSEKAIEMAMETKFSPEFMPVQILAEIGLSGFICFFILFIKSFFNTTKLVQILNYPFYLKILVLTILSINITNIINSNSLSSMTIYLFIFCTFLFFNSYNLKKQNE